LFRAGASRWQKANGMSDELPPANHAAASLAGKWALVTGAGRRVGAAIARTLHAHGAGVAIHYRGSAADALALAGELNSMRPGSALTIKADLLETGNLKAIVAAVITHAGRLDVLVNNASSFYPTPLAGISEEQWSDLLGTNLKAPLFLAQAALPHLRATRGVIINIVDIHAIRPLKDHTMYGAAKAGLGFLTRALARDLAPDIRVNGVAPGAILWPEGGVSESMQDVVLKQIPLKRVGDPSDIAGCVLYLVRDAPYVTGQIIAVDGGRSVGW
jgi:pteridine reductase